MAGTIDVGTIKVGGLAELKAQLREIKNELANATDPEQMVRLAQAAGEVQDQIIGMNEQIKVFATGSSFEATTNAFGLMQSQIMSLDFEGAAESAKTFGTALKGVNPSFIGTQIKGLISVVGSLTKAFIQFGLSLLANPIFLIVAAVVAITVAIIALMNYLGVLKPIIKAIGDAFKIVMDIINAVKQAFMELTDWLGLTANAAEDSARRQIKASEEASKAAKAASESMIDDMDHEIAKRKALGQETAILEAQKQKEIIRSGKLEAERQAIRIKEHAYLNDISAEELQKLKDSLNDQKKAVKDAEQELEIMRIQNAKKVADNAEKVAENARKVNEKRAADAEQYQQNRLAAERTFQDLELELMNEGVQKELKANQYKYQRLIEDLKFNDKLTGDERKRLAKEYEIVAGAEADEIRKANAEKEKEALKKKNEELLQIQLEANQKRIEIEDAQFALQQELDFNRMVQTDGLDAANRQKEIDTLVAKYDEKFAIAGNNHELEKQLTEQQKTELQDINDKYAKIAADKEEAERQAKIENVNKTTSMMADATKTGLQGISDIVGAFAGKSVSAQKKAFETQKKINIVMATIDMIKGAVSAFSNAQQLGPIAGPIVGALVAASVVASGIANIKKISATKFEGGTTTPSAPSTNTGGGGSAASTGGAAQPSFNLFGGANQANTMTGAKSVEAKPTTIQAVVVESEITTTQNKVKKMQESATL